VGERESKHIRKYMHTCVCIIHTYMCMCMCVFVCVCECVCACVCVCVCVSVCVPEEASSQIVMNLTPSAGADGDNERCRIGEGTLDRVRGLKRARDTGVGGRQEAADCDGPRRIPLGGTLERVLEIGVGGRD
jgi:hypothetical protein